MTGFSAVDVLFSVDVHHARKRGGFMFVWFACPLFSVPFAQCFRCAPSYVVNAYAHGHLFPSKLVIPSNSPLVVSKWISAPLLRPVRLCAFFVKHVWPTCPPRSSASAKKFWMRGFGRATACRLFYWHRVPPHGCRQIRVFKLVDSHQPNCFSFVPASPDSAVNGVTNTDAVSVTRTCCRI